MSYLSRSKSDGKLQRKSKLKEEVDSKSSLNKDRSKANLLRFFHSSSSSKHKHKHNVSRDSLDENEQGDHKQKKIDAALADWLGGGKVSSSKQAKKIINKRMTRINSGGGGGALADHPSSPPLSLSESPQTNIDPEKQKIMTSQNHSSLGLVNTTTTTQCSAKPWQFIVDDSSESPRDSNHDSSISILLSCWKTSHCTPSTPNTITKDLNLDYSDISEISSNDDDFFSLSSNDD
mmetsp:Transcript_1719/g.2401  ORF Transcript_1719/g.2401 Transcript_1719/m.2401 type:complete len:234 (+) Transcript_1719:31-732(+)